MSEKGLVRSTKIILHNKTSFQLTLINVDLKHGEWTNEVVPPFEIPPLTTNSFMSETAGFMTGTEGSVDYRIEVLDSKKFYVHIYWDNPFVGNNELKCKVDSFFHNPFLIKDEIDPSMEEVREDQYPPFSIYPPPDISGDEATYDITLMIPQY